MTQPKRSNYFRILLVLFSLFLLATTTFVGSFFFLSQREYTCIVEEKSTQERHGMRVYTECGDFAIGDIPFRSGQDPRMIYEFMLPGYEYDFITVGYRIPPINVYPFIYEVR